MSSKKWRRAQPRPRPLLGPERRPLTRRRQKEACLCIAALRTAHSFTLLREAAEVELPFIRRPCDRRSEVDQFERTPRSMEIGLTTQDSLHRRLSEPPVYLYGIQEGVWIVKLHVGPHGVRMIRAERTGAFGNIQPTPCFQLVDALMPRDPHPHERTDGPPPGCERTSAGPGR